MTAAIQKAKGWVTAGIVGGVGTGNGFGSVNPMAAVFAPKKTV